MKIPEDGQAKNLRAHLIARRKFFPAYRLANKQRKSKVEIQSGKGLEFSCPFSLLRARVRLRPRPSVNRPEPRALTQAVIQGAFILAKAKHGREVAADCIDHLHRYIELLFAQPKTQTKT
jgi:hypothetical protein